MVAVLNKQLTELTGETLYTTQELGNYPFYALKIYGNSVQDGTPTPEYPIPINNVGNDGTIEVVSCGENLLPSVKSETKTLNGITVESFGDGSYHISGTATSDTSVVFNLQTAIVLPQEMIYLSMNNSAVAVSQSSIAFKDGSTQLGYASFNEINRKLTMPELSGKNVNNFHFYVKGGATVNITCKPQLEINGYTDFEPYKGHTVATITSAMPLCSIGDICDELIYNVNGTGKIIKRTAKKVLSSDNIEAFFEHVNGNYFVTTVKGMSGENSDVAPVCSRFVGVPYNERTAEKYINTFRCYSAPDGKITLRNSASDNRFTSLSEMKEYVSANETVVVYPLAATQEIELTAAEMAKLQQLEALDGICNIYNSGNGEMYIRAMTAGFEYGHEVGFFDSKI